MPSLFREREEQHLLLLEKRRTKPPSVRGGGVLPFFGAGVHLLLVPGPTSGWKLRGTNQSGERKAQELLLFIFTVI